MFAAASGDGHRGIGFARWNQSRGVSARVAAPIPALAESYTMRRRDRRLVDAIEKKIGPFTGGDVLVLRDVRIDGERSAGDELVEVLTDIAQKRGLVGSPWVVEYVPVVITLSGDASIELLNEDDMRAAGWYRSPAYPVA